MTAADPCKPDAVGVRAVDAAREALLELVDAADVGEHLGYVAEDERVVTHCSRARRPGYRGWRWAVTVARAPRQKTVTVDEVVLLPGDDAITAPAWVPYRDRIQAGDLSPGDLLPTEEDDPRLVPGYLTGDPGDEIVDQDALRDVDRRARPRPGPGALPRGSRPRRRALVRRQPRPRGAAGAVRPGELRVVRVPGPAGRARCRRRSASAPTRRPTTTAGWSPGTTAAARTRRRSWPRRASPSRSPSPVLDTLSWDELETVLSARLQVGSPRPAGCCRGCCVGGSSPSR